MKCPECGFEGILEDEKFCGKCGAAIRSEESKWNAPTWKWGSLIVSTVFVFIFWFFIDEKNAYYYDWEYYTYFSRFLSGLALFGFPTIIYLMYKERTDKINYGLAWITFPLIIWLFGTDYPFEGEVFTYFILLVIPAIVIDIWYVRKLNEVGK